MTQLILASEPSSKALLQMLGITQFNQPKLMNTRLPDPTILVKELSLSKAKDIAMNYHAVVIGADTIAVHNNTISVENLPVNKKQSDFSPIEWNPSPSIYRGLPSVCR